MDKISGIYLITNIINSKKYVGSSVNIFNRWADHKKPKNLKSNLHLYNSFKKHGLENFKFEILVKSPKEYLEKLEIFFIKHYNSYNRELGYNMTKGGYGGLGPKHSEEQKKKWSISRKGIRWSNRTDFSSQSKKIIRISEDNSILIFNSISETKLETTSISRALKRYKISNKSNYSQGFHWMTYEDYLLNGIIIKPFNKGGKIKKTKNSFGSSNLTDDSPKSVLKIVMVYQ